jgi:hypothetical protein
MKVEEGDLSYDCVQWCVFWFYYQRISLLLKCNTVNKGSFSPTLVFRISIMLVERDGNLFL